MTDEQNLKHTLFMVNAVPDSILPTTRNPLTMKRIVEWFAYDGWPFAQWTSNEFPGSDRDGCGQGFSNGSKRGTREFRFKWKRAIHSEELSRSRLASACSTCDVE